jgi:quercetin dioxygenase-like cupin family protein
MQRSLRQTWAITLLSATITTNLGFSTADAQSDQPSSKMQDEPIKRTVLFRGNLEGVEGKEIVIFIAELTPGAVGSKHYHPGPEFFYVLEGTLAHEPEGATGHTMQVGDFGSNPNKAVHTIRNPDTALRAKAIDFLISDKGQPLVVPVK